MPCLSKALFFSLSLLRLPNIFLLESMHYTSIWFSVAHPILPRFKSHSHSLTSRRVATRDGLGIQYLLFYIRRDSSTTLYIAFDLTYYSELRNAINIYYIRIYIYIFANKGRFGCLDTIEHQHISSVRKKVTSVVEKYSTMYRQIVSDTKYHT